LANCGGGAILFFGEEQVHGEKGASNIQVLSQGDAPRFIWPEV
jgi:hypothetical protein